jgi:predicted Rossmann fold flavoprotein
MNKKNLVIIGGGAAGFFCAVNAARLNPLLQVTIIEKNNKLLSKVRVSGGGRCNVTHACFSIADMVKKYPRGASFLKKAFHHFFTTDTINWFAERNVLLKTEADGRMFPQTNTSETIIDCLIKEANRYAVEIIMSREIVMLKRENEKWLLQYKEGKQVTADYVCIASGGYSKAAQFEWLQQCGHTITPPVPSLFTFDMPGTTITSLMGVVADTVTIKIAGTKLQSDGPLLITHWGMSGPAILKLSAWAARTLQEMNYEFTVVVNWLPAFNENTIKEKLQQLRFQLAAQKIYNRNPFTLPARLWEYLLQQSDIGADMRWADVPAIAQNKLVKNLCTQAFVVKGKTTFKEEFVTAGGVALHEVDVNTMQSKIAPGLFFAGEVLDIDGVTGGFNFQNAWTTGWIAAKAIATS